MHTNRLLILSGLMMGALPATAAPSLHFDLPGGSLAGALAALSRQGSIDVGGSDPAISTTAVRPLRGDMSPARALGKLLADTPFVAEPIGDDAFRLVRRPMKHVREHTVISAEPAVNAQAEPLHEIIVLGSKREQPLFTSSGSTNVIVLNDGGTGPVGSNGESWLLARAPVLQSTEVGEGRNKLFIRGVADSSFTGPTQTTAGIYFGDVRVGYDGPDPNLNLYDVDRVEILEGPQGTLYGAGSIGGVIRIEPRAPELDSSPHGSVRIGGSYTQHGQPGYDAATMLDYAPIADRLGARIVAYRSREGGYIDAPTRNRKDVNSLTESGVRGAIRARPFDGVTIDASYLRQTSQQPDLQFAETGYELAHPENLAQPFSDRYKLARGIAEKKWDSGLAFRISGGVADHHISQRFDTARPFVPSPSAYDDTTDIRLDTVEARLSRTLSDGRGWVVGASSVWSTTGSERTVGALGFPRQLIGVTNRTREKAGFGELTLAIGKVLISGGARFTEARMDGEPSRRPVNDDFLRGSTTRRVDPDFGFSVPLAHNLIWFGQYQQGFRTGGLAVAQGLGRVATYQSDTIYVGHSGFRYRYGGRINASIDLSYARWDDIQADLVNRNGLPYTDNVGNGIVLAVEANADWAITNALKASGALLFNHSRLTDPGPAYASSGDRPLPASPKWTATAALAWRHPIGRLMLHAEARARYTGHSRIGVGPILDIPYGNYVDTGVVTALTFGRYEASIALDNLLGTQSNRFAIVNPFAVGLHNETAPLRPRNVRVGLAAHF